MKLTLCTACRRHVRVLDPGCPFCGGALEVARRSVPLPRLGRAAILAFGTSLAVSACGGSSTSAHQGGANSDGSGGESDPTSPVTPTDQPGTGDSGGVVAAYGAPAPPSPPNP